MRDAQIVTLEAGPGWLPRARVALAGGSWAPRRSGVRVGLMRRRRSGPASAHVAALAVHAGSACSTPFEANLAGASLERLTCMTLSRRLGPLGDSYIGPGERRRMLQSAGVPGVLYANPATEAIFSSSAESLGKGGLVGQVSQVLNAFVQSNVDVAKQAISSARTNTLGLLKLTKKDASTAAQAYETGGASLLTGMGDSGSGVGDILSGMGSYGGGYQSPPAQAVSTTLSISQYVPYVLLGGGVLILYSLVAQRRRR